MALFKILSGNSNSLGLNNLSQATPAFNEGYCYFLKDTNLFYIDYLDNNTMRRAPLNANTAISLRTARTISAGTAVTSDSPSFDGTTNITIPITSLKEAYTEWGGKDLSGTISPIDAAASSLHSANRFAFAKPAGITVEYSRDGGATYTDYGCTDEEKVNLVSGIGTNLYNGKRTESSAIATTNDKLRITLSATDMKVYTRLRKLLINLSTDGSTGSNVLIECSYKGSEDTFQVWKTAPITGWSGWNSIQFSCAFGGWTNSQTSNWAKIRLTFGITGINSNYASTLRVLDIVAVGDTYWNWPSEMAKTNHIYSWDYNQNTFFPNKISSCGATRNIRTELSSTTLQIYPYSATDPNEDIALYINPNGGTTTIGKSDSTRKINLYGHTNITGGDIYIKAGDAGTIAFEGITTFGASDNPFAVSIYGPTAIDGNFTLTANDSDESISLTGPTSIIGATSITGATKITGDFFLTANGDNERIVIDGNSFTVGVTTDKTMPIYFYGNVNIDGSLKLSAFNNVSQGQLLILDSDKYIDHLTSDIGSATQPVYVNAGVLTACNTTLDVGISGNAASASKLATARTISLTGDVSGSVSFDGSENVSITTTVADNSHSHSYLPLAGGTMTGEIKIGQGDGYGIQLGTGGRINATTSAGSTTATLLGLADTQCFIGHSSFSATIRGMGSRPTYNGSNMALLSDITDTKVTTAEDTLSTQSYVTTCTGATTGSLTYHSSVYINHITGVLMGAAWNDYAEYREQVEEIKPGYCVASNDNGKVSKTTEKLQACDGIVSDTFGFAIGETDKCKTPLAVAGRVLAYCEGNRNDYHAGDTVCAGPKGKVSKMSREEIREWPDRIVGIVSEIPNYESWGESNVAVDNRIWIKIK